MEQETIFIPTLNDGSKDFKKLFAIYNQIKNHRTNIIFDFSKCFFLRPNAVAFFGGLSRLVESRSGTITFDWTSIKSSAVLNNLCQNGFAGHFGHSMTAWDGNSIPYREDHVLDMNNIMDYLTINWIGKGWVHVSNRLADAIVGKMWEIYSNAFEHSSSTIGIFTCGQYYKQKNDLILSVFDFGRGIPFNVREFFLEQNVDSSLVAQLTDANCLKWAFKPGNTTTTGGVARGLGLDLLKEFIQLNHGKLEIYSNDGYAIIDTDGERYENRESSFEGTAVHITLRCDESLYSFRDEIQSA